MKQFRLGLVFRVSIVYKLLSTVVGHLYIIYILQFKYYLARYTVKRLYKAIYVALHVEI